MKTIKSNSVEIIVDDDIYELIKNCPIAWNGKYPTFRLHHFVCNPTADAPVVDHINGNKCDARRENLRACTIQQNVWNRKAKEYGTKFIGVDRHKQSGTFRMRLVRSHSGIKVLYEARFSTTEEAARARDICAIFEFDAFATLNFPRETYAGIDVETEAKKFIVGRTIVRKTVPKSSRFRGVHRASASSFRAVLKYKCKRYDLGVFENETDAAEAYNLEAQRLLGPRARLNVLSQK